MKLVIHNAGGRGSNIYKLEIGSDRQIFKCFGKHFSEFANLLQKNEKKHMRHAVITAFKNLYMYMWHIQIICAQVNSIKSECYYRTRERKTVAGNGREAHQPLICIIQLFKTGEDQYVIGEHLQGERYILFGRKSRGNRVENIVSWYKRVSCRNNKSYA